MSVQSTKDICSPLAVIDMGSNGIRFGIVSKLARHLPVTYEERAPISLFDAQGEERIIPEDTIQQVLVSFRRFQKICKEANVRQPDNVKVIATEATRLASNAQEFLTRIYDTTGWSVSLLSKAEEAMISAAGIVGTFYKVDGLTMDLGGGSFEFSYVTSNHSSTQDPNACGSNSIKVSDTPVSLPYGAAALKRRLAQCTSQAQRQALHDDIVIQIREAVKQVGIPEHLENGSQGYTIYMSGGGFRALGYLSMARKKDFYPLPIISGYSISGSELKEIAKRNKHKNPDKAVKQLRGFRISKRRAAMIPAVCFLVSALIQVIPVRQVFFSEGGVRQGLCYTLLSNEEQQKDPLLSSVQTYVKQVETVSTDRALSSQEFDAIWNLLKSAIPACYLDPDHPLQLHRLLPAAIHLSNITSHYPKDTRAFVAFHMPLASGTLANVPGISHTERVILALLLAYRQGGQVPDPTFRTAQHMVGSRGTAVCRFIGRLLELLFLVSPLSPGSGVVKSGIQFSTECTSNNSTSCTHDNGTNKFYPNTRLRIHLQQSTHNCPMVEAPSVLSIIEGLEQRVNPKFDMDEEQRAMLTNLFSVTVVRSP
ncbi:actin-like ATPase domain-containing protein [Lichtheimia hyalospora FSU 10163]|nr:actin-like ATPase domain-containing protein [Lichtheimia hyalospora FSU 10163]